MVKKRTQESKEEKQKKAIEDLKIKVEALKAKDNEQSKQKEKRFKKTKLETIEEVEKSLHKQNRFVRCFLIDEVSGLSGERIISSALVPDNSLPVNDDGPIYLLNFDGKQFTQIDYMPTDNAGQTPADTMDFMDWSALERVLQLSQGTLEKIQIGIIIAFGIGILVLIFLMGSMGMGG